MEKYALIFLAILLFASAKVFSNSAFEKSNIDDKDPKNNKNISKPQNLSNGEDLELNHLNAASLEELRAILEEIDANEALSEANYLKEQLLHVAREYQGIRYKYGGMSRSGMDCSGFVKVIFDQFNISLPRTSREMARVGKKITKNKAQKGDLIFFKMGKSSRINHVGIITEVLEDEIRFIHASGSKGVTISSTKEAYYKKRFSQASRVYLKTQ